MSPTALDLSEIEHRLDLSIKSEHVHDYLQLLARTDSAIQHVLSMPDYTPSVDLQRFPRSDIHIPTDAENPHRGWAYKVIVKGAPEGILKGRNLCLKDTICLAKAPCHFGTAVIDSFIPDIDATIVTRILDHGGTIIGKATCEDMSHGATSFTSQNGPVQNPYAHGFSAGGSSSGCGALIGSGQVEMGVGGDQGGSVRIPAALCGIVGLKPTFGLVPYTGVLSSEASLDHIGPMARTVSDTALLLQAIAGYDGIDDRQLGAPAPDNLPCFTAATTNFPSNPLIGTKIGILTEGFSSPHLAPDVESVVRTAIDKFTSLGATVINVSVPGHLKTASVTHVINKLGSSQARLGKANARRGLYINEIYDQLLPWSQEKWDKVHSFVQGTAISGEYGFTKYPSAYGRAMNIVRKLKNDYDAVLQDVDVLVMPTVPVTARRHAPPGAGPLDCVKKADGLVDNTAIFNGTGHPALSIPVGFGSPAAEDVLQPEDEQIRLPVGMQIVGPLFGEDICLRVGAAWEAGWDWKTGSAK